MQTNTDSSGAYSRCLFNPDVVLLTLQFVACEVLITESNVRFELIGICGIREMRISIRYVFLVNLHFSVSFSC